MKIAEISPILSFKDKFRLLEAYRDALQDLAKGVEAAENEMHSTGGVIKKLGVLDLLRTQKFLMAKFRVAFREYVLIHKNLVMASSHIQVSIDFVNWCMGRFTELPAYRPDMEDRIMNVDALRPSGITCLNVSLWRAYNSVEKACREGKQYG